MNKSVCWGLISYVAFLALCTISIYKHNLLLPITYNRSYFYKVMGTKYFTSSRCDVEVKCYFL